MGNRTSSGSSYRIGSHLGKAVALRVTGDAQKDKEAAPFFAPPPPPAWKPGHVLCEWVAHKKNLRHLKTL